MGNDKQISDEQLLALIEGLIRDAPFFVHKAALTNSELHWLGRAEVILEHAGTMLNRAEFQTEKSKIGERNFDMKSLLGPIYATYARVELRSPVSSGGSFIPAGDTWNGYAALVKLVQRTCNDLLIIDPYIDGNAFMEFVPHSAASKTTRFLTTKNKDYHPALSAAVSKWLGDKISKDRFFEVRYAPTGSLHDRLIKIDGSEAWLISQSMKDIAKRSPASVFRAEPAITELKFAHYNQIWTDSKQIF